MGKSATKSDDFSPAKSDRTPQSLKLRDDKGTLSIEIDGDFCRMCHASTGRAVVPGLVKQIAAMGSQATRLDEGASNFAIDFLDTMEPKDAAEALLLTQMAAIHHATMMLVRQLNHVDKIAQQDAAERALNKVARTYTAQMDTLKRYRSKGQTIRVKRVTVEKGGPAIVGNVTKGGRQ